MSAVTVKITYYYRITARQVLEKIKAAMCGNGFEVALEAAEFGASTAPARESVASELISLSEKMDTVAEHLYSLGLCDASDAMCGRCVSSSIELHGAADMAREWAGEIGA